MFALFSRYGLWTRWRVEQQYRQVRRSYEELVRRADSLAQRLRQLRSDSTELERLAREHYGMARPGEKLYRVPEEP
ncbi:Cell division protein FtsB [bacterium HR21]|nr:Cell division protein FtsB [bacterium HR21]